MGTADDQAGVLVIHVPQQRETDKLFVIRGRTPAEGARVPIRDDDGTPLAGARSGRYRFTTEPNLTLSDTRISP